MPAWLMNSYGNHLKCPVTDKLLTIATPAASYNLVQYSHELPLPNGQTLSVEADTEGYGSGIKFCFDAEFPLHITVGSRNSTGTAHYGYNEVYLSYDFISSDNIVIYIYEYDQYEDEEGEGLYAVDGDPAEEALYLHLNAPLIAKLYIVNNLWEVRTPNDFLWAGYEAVGEKSPTCDCYGQSYYSYYSYYY